MQKTPADVRFTLTVTNNSNIKAEDIAITHGETEITTIDALEAGESKTLVRDVRISQAGKFRFTASSKDTMNNVVSFDSNTLQVGYAPATAAPTVEVRPTVAPPRTVTPAPVDPVLYNTRNALMTVAGVLGALFGVAFLLFAVSTVMRLKNKNKSKKAYDHLELSEKRDYTEPAENADEEQAPVAEEAAVEVVPVDEKPAGDGEGGYRFSREAAEEEVPQERHAVNTRKTDEEEE